MLLNKRNLAIADVCVKDNGNYSLDGIQVTPKETVATDGHVLLRVSAPNMDVAHFPEIQGVTAVADFDTFVLPRKAASAIEKAIPTDKAHPVLEYASIGQESDGNDRAVIGVTDLDTHRVFSPRKLENKFPDADKVTPEIGAELIKITADVKYLLKILKHVERFHAGERVSYVEMRFYGDNVEPIRFDAVDPTTGQTLTAVLMPIRDKRDKADALSCLRKLDDRAQRLRTKFEIAAPGTELRLADVPDDNTALRAIADGCGGATVELVSEHTADCSHVMDRCSFADEASALKFIDDVSEGRLELGDRFTDQLKAA